MVINASSISKEQIIELKRTAQKTFIKSNFKFIQEHRGFRPKAIHVLMGTAGSGKSTVVRAIIADMLKINPDSVFMWLSEESVEDVMTGLIDNNIEESDLSKLNFSSELDSNEDMETILETVAFTNSKVLVIDNITTSKFYMDKPIQEQGAFISRLKKFASDNDVAVVMVAHTKKDIHDNMGKLITENDIRGCSAVVNMANFFYILQRFEINDHFYPTVRIMKSRGQQTKDRLFHLKYSLEEQTYTEDKKLDFKSFKEAYDMRNKL